MFLVDAHAGFTVVGMARKNEVRWLVWLSVFALAGSAVVGQTIYSNAVQNNTTPEDWGESANWDPAGVPGFDVLAGLGNSNDIAFVEFLRTATGTSGMDLNLQGSNYVLQALLLREDTRANRNADGNIISTGAASLTLQGITYVEGGRELDFYADVTVRDWDDGIAFLLDTTSGNSLDFAGAFQGNDGLRIDSNNNNYFRNYQMSYGVGPSNGLILASGSTGGTKNFWIEAVAGDVTHTIPDLVIESNGNVNIDFGRSAGTNNLTVNISNVHFSAATDRFFIGGGSEPNGEPSTTVNVLGRLNFGQNADANINIKIDSVYDGIVNFHSNIIQNHDGAATFGQFTGNGIARVLADMLDTNGSLRTLATRIDGGRSLVVAVDAQTRLGAGTVDMRAGSVLKLNYDAYSNALATGFGFPGSNLVFGGGANDQNDMYFDFGVAQSGFFDPFTGDTNAPLTVVAFNGIAGDLTGAIYSGPGQNVIIQTNAIIGENALNKPTYADVGQSVWAGIRDGGGTYTNIVIADGTNIFRGVALSALAPLGNGELPNTSQGNIETGPFLSGFHGTLEAAPGIDLEVLLSGEVNFTPRTNDLAATFNADTGIANVRGPGNMILQQRQGVTPLTGTVTQVNRIGRGGIVSDTNPLGLNDQNQYIADLIGDGSLEDGDTLKVTDGQIRLRNNGVLGLANNTTNTRLIVGSGASMVPDNANNNDAATIALNRGQIIFEDDGAFYTSAQPDRFNPNAAVIGAMVFSGDAMFVMNDSSGGGGNATPNAVRLDTAGYNHLFTNMHLVVNDQNLNDFHVENADSFAIGEGRRLTGPANNSVGISNIFTVAGGVTSLTHLTAAPDATGVAIVAPSQGNTRREIRIEPDVLITNATLTIGATNAFITVNRDGTIRSTADGSGTVRLYGSNNRLKDVDVIGGSQLIIGDGAGDVTTISGDLRAWEPNPIPGGDLRTLVTLNAGTTTIGGDLIHGATINQTTNGATSHLNRLEINGDTNIISGSVIVGPLGQGSGSARLYIHGNATTTASVTRIAGDLIIDTPFQPESGAHVIQRGDVTIGSNVIINASGLPAQTDSNAAFNATYLRLDADFDETLGDGFGLADRLIDGSFAQGPEGVVMRDYALLILDFRTNDLPLVSGAIRDLAVGQKITIDNTGPNYPGNGANDGMISLNRTGGGTLVYQLTNIWMSDGSYLRINENAGTRALAGITLMGTGAISLGSTAENEPFELTDVRSDTPGQARVLQIGATNGPNFTAFPTTLLGTSTVDVTFDVFNGSLTVTNGSGDVQGGVKVWEGSTFEIVGGGSEEILNLAGNGLVLGDVTVSNILSPGLSPGTLTVTGSMAFLPTSILQFELDGSSTNAGAGINDLLVLAGGGGNLTLDGTLDVTELNTFTNQGWGVGDYWTLITYEGGIFNNNGLDFGSLPELDPGLAWALDTGIDGEIRLAIVIPEPSTWALLVAGLGLMGRFARRRR